MRRGLAVAIACALAAPAAAQRPGWDVRIPDRIDLATGAAGSIPIAIALDRGLVVSRDADILVDVRAPAAVAVKKRRLTRRDAVDPEADAPRFVAAVKADAPGDHVVEVRLRFWLCGARSCRPVDLRRKTTLAVAPPAPPAVPDGP